MDILKINKLFSNYGNKEVLKDLSMDIKENKITAIIGPSGCGKSTLLTVLNLMIEENGGSFLGGKYCSKARIYYHMKKNDIRKRIGMVFQRPTPFPLSIYKNLTYAPPIYYGIKDKKELDNIVENSLKKKQGFFMR